MEKIVEVKNLSKKYGKQQILKDVSFELSEREIVGFIGPNGAGKSTTMKCLCSLIFPDAGSIQICGYDLKTEREKALGNLSAMIESPALYPNLTGMQNLKLFANLKQVSNERIKELEVFTKLEKDLHKKVSKYSMGMKQRLALGIALLNKPKFIILDEPTNGLDPSGIIELREILQELKTKENVSILFSSHTLGEVEKIADRIICINKGEIIPAPQKIKQLKYLLKVDCVNDLLELVNENKKIHAVQVSKEDVEITFENEGIFSFFIKEISKKNINLFDIKKVEIDVEQVYQEIYGE